MGTLSVNDLLVGHVGLDIECMDRIYLNGYVPSLQVGGQVAGFMTRHLGYPIPSPAIMERIGTSFRRAVNGFGQDHHIPLVRFGKDDRKIDVMRPYVAAQARTEPPWVRWRLLTLETRMESCRRNSRLGSRRRVATARRRRPTRSGWSARCAPSWAPSTARCSGSRSNSGTGSSRSG